MSHRYPIGAEESFKVWLTFIKMKAIYWHDETMGADYTVEEIPANLVDEAMNGEIRCSKKWLSLTML